MLVALLVTAVFSVVTVAKHKWYGYHKGMYSKNVVAMELIEDFVHSSVATFEQTSPNEFFALVNNTEGILRTEKLTCLLLLLMRILK